MQAGTGAECTSPRFYTLVGSSREHLGQRFDHNVLIIDDAAGVVTLDRKGSAGQLSAGHAGVAGLADAFRFGIVHRYLAIDHDNNVFALNIDLFGKPLVVLGRGLFDIDHRIQSAGAFPVAVAVIDLHFVALVRPARVLIFGVKVQPGVGVGLGHHIGLKLKIREVGAAHRADIEQVAAVALDDEHPVLNAEGVFVFAGLPAVERFSIEQADPPVTLFGHLFLRLASCQKDGRTNDRCRTDSNHFRLLKNLGFLRYSA